MSQSEQPIPANADKTPSGVRQASISDPLSRSYDAEKLLCSGRPSHSPKKTAESHGQRTGLDITVAIPTYNGARKLPSLLDRLRVQTNTDHIKWEVIVCDNGSTDDTAALVRSYQADWPSQYRLHYRFAAEQGAAFARQHAVESSRGDLIAFLDDDNIPAHNWVAQAYEFAQTRPQAGAFGSQIHGKFESGLPDELENIKCFLAIIERGEQPHLYERARKILPPAAGLVVRRQVWLQTVPKRLFLNNKGKSAGLASEDLEAILHIQKAGWEIWYNPSMVVHHDIPDGRLRKDYLVTLFRCVGLSRSYIRMLGTEHWKQPVAVPAYIANDVCKLALHRLRYGRQGQLTLPDRCHRELLISTLKSPFFLVRKAFKDSVQAYQDKQHRDRHYWLTQITTAFETDQFALYQQPVVSLVQLVADESAYPVFPGRTTEQPPEQKEILLRLHSSNDGCALPDNFMPTAKRYGLMRTIDRWVISRLFAQIEARGKGSRLSATQANAPPGNGLMYSINLSQDSIEDRNLVQFIQSALAKTNLPPQLFCFEIPAKAIAASPEPTRHLIRSLHTLGYKVTLDGATVSDSTAELIACLPLDYVKIDIAALKAIHSGNHLWEAFRQMTRHHSVQTIAKSIESQAGLETVRQQGIPYAQGYRVGRPQPL